MGIFRRFASFFETAKEWGWLPRKFDPNRCLRTPTSIKRLIGPDPRVVADDIWAKLVWAGLNLNEVELPCTGHGRFLYPFPMVHALAVAWLFTGLRADEMLRLRVGSIRWDGPSKAGSGKSETRTCLLNVPVNPLTRRVRRL